MVEQPAFSAIGKVQYPVSAYDLLSKLAMTVCVSLVRIWVA